MKKHLFVIVLLLTVIIPAGAQLKVDFGSYAFGPSVTYGLSSDYKNVGVGLSVQKFMGDHFRPTVYGSYFFENNHLSLIEFGVDFHYVFPLTKQMGVYPLVGMGYSILKLKGVNELPPMIVLPDDYGDEEEGKFHFNLGAGYEYYITPSVKAFGELKYHHINDFGRTNITVGVAYVW